VFIFQRFIPGTLKSHIVEHMMVIRLFPQFFDQASNEMVGAPGHERGTEESDYIF
jgi:hypothetical protein